MIIEHIVDQVWVQYDYDKNGILDIRESSDFLKTVLQLHQNMIAKLKFREPRQITDEEVAVAMEECDKDHDRQITRQELNTWIVEHMKKQEELALKKQVESEEETPKKSVDSIIKLNR